MKPSKILGAGALSIGLAACEPGPIMHDLIPLEGMEDAVPVLTQKETIVLHTTAGDVTIEVYPEAAPNSAQRFVELVESGYYDGVPISRVVPGFVAQFGINWREPHNDWQNRSFDDDPTLFAHERGTLAFAKAGPNTASTQVFVNYVENNRLAQPDVGAFTVFGMVVEGMEIVDGFPEVGTQGAGLNQPRLWSEGQTYLDQLVVQPAMIDSAEVQ